MRNAMQCYYLENQLHMINYEKAKQFTKNLIIVLNDTDIKREEWRTFTEEAYLLKQEKLHFCKAETYSEYIYGTFSMPQEIQKSKKNISFSYCIQKHGILFLDNSGFVLSHLEKLKSTKIWKRTEIGYFFAVFLEELVKNDLEILENVQKKLMNLEEEILENQLEKFNHKIITIKKEILGYYRYYAQLIELGQELRENEAEIFEKEDISLLRLFAERAARLKGEAELLREYSIQVREAYQAQIDIKQNNIMKMLTIVTTIFLPLSLIAGWYGMNFDNMPELHWKYSYFILIGISAFLLGICLWLFKKKKFW